MKEEVMKIYKTNTINQICSYLLEKNTYNDSRTQGKWMGT
jgi:hypothetical protein